MSTPSKPLALLTSTVALKIVVAITGLGMVGFVGFHMAGNLIVFQGREAYNDYAEFMQSLGAFKWAARGGLLTILGAPGCFLLASVESSANQPTTPLGTASVVVPVPGDPALFGGRLYHQMVVFDPPANVLGATVSNGVAVVLGR